MKDSMYKGSIYNKDNPKFNSLKKIMIYNENKARVKTPLDLSSLHEDPHYSADDFNVAVEM